MNTWLKGSASTAIAFGLSVTVALGAVTSTPGKGTTSGPVKGGSYSGSLNVAVNEVVSFKVSKNGKMVTGTSIKPFIPTKCGSGGPPPKESSKPASIKNGKFSATVTTKASNGKVIAKATVSGKFGKNKTESGTVKTVIPSNKSCNGSFPYKTKSK